MNLKEKPTRGQREALWESLAPYCFCRHDFKRLREGERERVKRAELWKGRGTERGRGWTCLARKGRKIDKKSDRERNAA